MEAAGGRGSETAGADFVPRILSKRNFWVHDATLLHDVQQAYAQHEHALRHGRSAVHDAPPLIPHTLHFIWLGSEVPDWVQRNISSWQAHHPSWEIRLWSDADAAAFSLVNRQAFDAARNFGEKSDILRYEILHRHGGCYVDCDMECVGKLDGLHATTTMYCGMSNTSALEINNALIGCAPNHPVMADVVSRISRHHRQREMAKQASIMVNIAGFLGGSLPQQLLSTQQSRVGASSTAAEGALADTIAFSGPGMFTCAVADALAPATTSDDRSDGEAGSGARPGPTLVVLPPYVFYPIPNNEPCLADSERYRQQRTQFVRRDTIAVHQWACSWQR